MSWSRRGETKGPFLLFHSTLSIGQARLGWKRFDEQYGRAVVLWLDFAAWQLDQVQSVAKCFLVIRYRKALAENGDVFLAAPACCVQVGILAT